jgi:hypothetical protein
MFHRRIRTDRGAVAIIVAVAAVAIFGIAAMAVDLGNAFARTKAVQSQADLAALAGGGSLPGAKTASDDAVKAVVEYLNHNQPQSDGQSCVPSQNCVTANQLVNGNDADGEVHFLSNTLLRVISPPANVRFSLAGVLGVNKTAVQREATVGIFSPGPVVPFFLPQDCSAGTVVLKASSYNPGAPTFTPASGSGSDIAKVNSLSTTTVPGGVPTTLTIFGEKFNDTPIVDFHLAGSSDRVPNDTTTGHPATRTVDGVRDDEATTTLPPAVFNKPGTWYMRVNNTQGWSRDVGIFIVGNPTPPPAGCGQRATGDFGVVDSPRTNGPVPSGNLAEASALNMALGLDHNVVPWNTTPPQPPVQDTCHGYGGTAVSGAINDKSPSQDGRNCLDVKNGMNTDTVTDGMITGAGGQRGRLDTGFSICNRTGGSGAKDRLGYQTNDDVLSCFLEAGVTVGDVSGESISGGDEQSISSEIFDSPRFMTVPVIDYPLNPQNGFYPVVGMQPVFITDESSASEKDTSYASADNGVTIQSSKVVQLTVVAINPAALPETADSGGPVAPWLGSGTKIVRLVN